MFTKTSKALATLFLVILLSELLGVEPEKEVLILTKTDVIKLPKGKVQATLNEIQAPREVMRAFETLQVQEIRKAMPDFNPADTFAITPEGNIARLPDFSNLFALRLPSDMNRDSAVTLLEALPQIIYAEKNQRAELFFEPNDPHYKSGLQWNLKNEGQYGGKPDADIDAPEAWDWSRGSWSTKLGIVDNGVDRNHEDLKGKVFGDVGYSAHGTHVAGIAAAWTNNKDPQTGEYIGIAGIDWNAQINNQKIEDWEIPELAQAVIDAANSGCKVINCSWGHPDFSYTLYNAFTYAYQKNVLPVAALPYPDRDWENPNGFGLWMFTVNASRNTDEIAGYTLGKRYTDIAAPGGEKIQYEQQRIYSTLPGNSYGYMSGTSMAAPHATGVAGLLLAANSNLKNYDLEWIMKLFAEDKGAPGWDKYFGYGRLNAEKSFRKVMWPYEIFRGG
ncbi:hypothetical protein DRP53_09945 [candidate division WOR-3 bacterium]|uniref:Peptidase S8/S53 domain-containing protein n=1 Tax=candidate division WOR-3 bacterium TaxID=2052148 RepID=A0A660SDB0_UNCW3|nr:MAG: hypothetical protein DRP53_09945 [candidate division WOR-3 bacterium]